MCRGAPFRLKINNKSADNLCEKNVTDALVPTLTVLGVMRPFDWLWSEMSEFFLECAVSEFNDEVESVRFLGLSGTRVESYGNLFSSSSIEG